MLLRIVSLLTVLVVIFVACRSQDLDFLGIDTHNTAPYKLPKSVGYVAPSHGMLGNAVKEDEETSESSSEDEDVNGSKNATIAGTHGSHNESSRESSSSASEEKPMNNTKARERNDSVLFPLFSE